MNMFNQISKCTNSVMLSSTTTTTTFLKSFRVKKIDYNNKKKEQAHKQKHNDRLHQDFTFLNRIKQRVI